MKYHINPDTGKTGQCTAKKGNCRFGAAVLHYGTREDAQKAFEMSMEGETFAKAAKKKTSTAWAAKVAANPNFDVKPIKNSDEGWARLDEIEQNELWNKDTIVRDWYWEARLNKLNHNAALTFAQDWDDFSSVGMDEDGFNYQDEYYDLLLAYVKGDKKAL